MNTPKNYVIAFFALTTVALAAFAWVQYQELISLRATELDSDTQRAAWQKKLWQAQQRTTDLESKVSSLEKASARSLDGPPDGPGGPRGRGGMRQVFFAAMDNPQVQRLMAVQEKAVLDQHYAKLFKSLALSPEQLDKFKNLLVEKQTAMMDVLAAAREQGINPRADPQAFQKLVSDAQASINANILSTLGDAGFSQYQQYEQTLPERNTVDQVAQKLSYTSTPLTEQQQDQLTQLLAANAPPAKTGTTNPMAALGGPGGNAQAHINQTDIAQAAGILTADQVAAMQEVQAAQQARAEMEKLMRQQAQSQSGSSSTSTATPPPPPGG